MLDDDSDAARTRKKVKEAVDRVLDIADGIERWKSPNQMDRTKPDGVERVEPGNTNNNTKDHVHFEDGSALNRDGTVHHTSDSGEPPNPTRKQRKWLKKGGWAPAPIEKK